MPIYVGIDWSSQKHDVAFVNEQGGVIQCIVIEHSETGFKKLESVREGLSVSVAECVVGIETAHTLLIEHLWEQGYAAMYVLPPGTVNANRSRNRQSGARNDRSDSIVIAETLRTDRRNFHPWQPGSEPLQQMRSMVSQANFWTQQSVRLANRLHALLSRYYPAALAVFKSWPTPLNCAFVLAYPSPEDARALSWEEFEEFAKAQRYPRRKQLPSAFLRLKQALPAQPVTVNPAYVQEACCLASALHNSLQVEKQNLAQLNDVFHSHPDAAIFASLPGVGDWLAPALLTKVGEDRLRFPSPQALQALAGTCPVTRQSGKKRTVLFRRSCDHAFRHIVQQWARSAVKHSDWAHTYFQQQLDNSKRPNAAYRALANRLLAILWKLWQTQTLYDEAVHLRNRINRTQPVR